MFPLYCAAATIMIFTVAQSFAASCPEIFDYVLTLDNEGLMKRLVLPRDKTPKQKRKYKLELAASGGVCPLGSPITVIAGVNHHICDIGKIIECPAVFDYVLNLSQRLAIHVTLSLVERREGVGADSGSSKNSDFG
ncbi:hypothetical protein HELRODRAFT_165741 [Helobdella robusta]|uniref:Uncharacterized protein n=1 Tax=Helobdella robusta TaxID=6412 RepID=T1EX84_HELRO|nr:hypothetical protein HELRODRAFT_165741 [Helobdella robusta]ESN91683.1 hypothetical protein HELRODRAFT_165741 [Helobdella robusta]